MKHRAQPSSLSLTGMEHDDNFKLGYAMGLIAGEGSFTGDWKNPALQVRLHQRDIGVLEYLKSMFGGRIYGPYNHDNRHYSFWSLRGKELERLLPILEANLPDSYKRQQFLVWLDKYGHLKRLLELHHSLDDFQNPFRNETG